MTLPVVSAASSLLSWDQLSGGLQRALEPLGGAYDSWVVHHAPEAFYVTGPSPTTWYAAPWMQRLRQPPTAEERLEVIWHKGVDDRGLIISQGPGSSSRRSSFGGGKVDWTFWAIPRKFRALDQHRNQRAPPQGFDEHGKPSAAGPFWLVCAPELSDLLNDGGEHQLRADDPEALQAAQGLEKLSRIQHCQPGSKTLDYAELFSASSALPLIRASGLRIPPDHELFCEAAGWHEDKKEHRQRLRRFLRERNPGLIGISLSDGLPLQGSERDCVDPSVQAKRLLRRGIALETVREQVASRRAFFLEDNALSETWHDPSWKELLTQPNMVLRTFLSGEDGWTIVTNEPMMGAALTELPEEALNSRVFVTNFIPLRPEERGKLSSSEGRAYHLRSTRNYSRSACLKLLGATSWGPETSFSGRGKSWRNEHYRTLGKFVHGGVSGVTRASRYHRQLALYLNEFLDYHGAKGARSSITISKNSRPDLHRDVNNVGCNCSMALGKFSGGQLWIEDPTGPLHRRDPHGKWIRGRTCAHHGKMVIFDPRKLHGVEPFQGTRWSITGYLLRTAPRETKELDNVLSEYGFNADLPVTFSSTSTPTASFFTDRVAGAARGLASGASSVDFVSYPVVSEELEEAEDDQPVDELSAGQPNAKLTEAQKAMVRKVHVNTGHPPQHRFLRTLKAAGALPQVLRYVREEFHCDDCDVRRRGDHRRKAQCPCIFSFNRVLSVDVFYLHFLDRSVPILNMVCSGTSYHVVQRVETDSSGTPSAGAVWKAFMNSWVRFLGPPSLLICDGGSEFRGVFERGLEQLGTLQHVAAPESPWANSKAERHGGWLKERLKMEITGGRCTMTSLPELDEFLAGLTAAKNRFYNAGGHCPAQLVFGELPRVPAELLSSHSGGLQALDDAFHDVAGLDEMGAEFRRRMQIREQAKRLALEADSKEAVKRAMRTSSTPTRHWNQGQWVYVYRRGKAGDHLHPVSRWVGPGLVVLQTKSLMRTRLWRCGPEQLRPADPSEMMGRQLATDPALGELLRQVTAGSQAKAVDVAREGPPPEDDEAELHRLHDGPDLSGPAVPLPVLPQQAPQEVPPVPPGLLPPPRLLPPPHDPGLREARDDPLVVPPGLLPGRGLRETDGAASQAPGDHLFKNQHRSPRSHLVWLPFARRRRRMITYER